MQRPKRKLKRLVVPVALAVATVAAATAALSANTGCGDDPVPVDASVDAQPDTPIV